MKDDKSIAELDKLLSIIDEFSFKMKERIIKKHLDGKKGWETNSLNQLLDRIEGKLDIAENDSTDSIEEALIDIANYAMFAEQKLKEGNK